MKLATTAALIAGTFSGLVHAAGLILIEPYQYQYKQGALEKFFLDAKYCKSFDTRWNDRIRSLEISGDGDGQYLYCFFFVDWACKGNYHVYKIAPGNPNRVTLNQIPPSFDKQYSSVNCNYGSG